MKRLHIIAFLFLSLLPAIGSDSRNELAVHLLSYLSQDYGEAVSEGEIISQGEYDEQIEFINEVSRISKNGSYKQELSSQIQSLKEMIEAKASVKEVSNQANEIKFNIIKAFNIATFPRGGLDLAKAKKIYAQSCVGCHGSTGAGDGPLGKGLEPSPTNFQGLNRMQNIPPFQAYNTITLGVDGTGMAGYSFLSDEERWSLAFYVSTFRYQGKKVQENYDVPLEDLASLTDIELLQKYNITEDEKTLFLASVRNIADNFPPEGPTKRSGNEYLEIAKNKLNESYDLFKKGMFQDAKDKSLESYLKGIEPIEGYLKVSGNSLVFSLEQSMANYRSLLNKSSKAGVVEKQYREVLTLFDKAERVISSDTSFVASALLSFGIVAREALEAGLILLLLLGMVKKFGSSSTLKWVHGGWIGAIVMGVGLYFLMDMIVGLGGYAVESIEAWVALFASLMLFYVGFWFHRNSNIEQMKENIKSSVKSSLVDNKKTTLLLIAFFSVFREIFETLLFMKILVFDGHGKVAIGAGAMGAIAIAGVLIVLISRFSMKINLRPLFKGSTFLILTLSVVFLGKALEAFQKVGILDQTQIKGIALSLLGYNSTLEVLVGQLFLVLSILGVVFYLRRTEALVKAPSGNDQ
ncbi:MAG: hypothetical protein CMJ16_03250 [Peredibacter sp.]|nr:hypothetical protein [Peredibacter sp.]